jgi:hypothetical protein
MNEDIFIPLIVFGSIVIVALGVPLVRSYARRKDKELEGNAVTPDVTQRLERMEQAIDAIAVEVERISEGQRFTTKLLSERASAEPSRLPPSREPGQ